MQSPAVSDTVLTLLSINIYFMNLFFIGQKPSN